MQTEATTLDYEFTFRSRVGAPVNIGPAPSGQRMIFPMSEGVIEGKRIKGRFLSGGDWLIVGSDGFGRVDVRAEFETHDGAFMHAAYTGPLEMNEALATALQSGKGTRFEDAYLRTALRLECGDPRYAWVNQTLFVAAGHLLEGGFVEYRVYRVN